MLDGKTMAKVIYCSWAGFGVVIDNIVDNVDEGKVKVHVTVPETSDRMYSKQINGTTPMMAGEFLAKRLKKVFSEMYPQVTWEVLYRINKGQHWTEELGKRAEQSAMDLVHMI